MKKAKAEPPDQANAATQGRAIALALAMAFLLLLPGGAAFATPTPPYILVNHTTRQCAMEILGDECNWCDPPSGWEVLGDSRRIQCPADYTQVRLDVFGGPNCKRYENQFCCSGFSGQGDCRNMVVNDSQKLCAFVPDITGCTLPNGWAGRPSSVAEDAWHCPYSNSSSRWGDAIACLKGTVTPEPTVIPPPTATPQPTPTSAPWGGALGLLCSLLVAAGALLAWSKRPTH